MSEADARLTALLRQDDPPARDPGFRLAVLERLARRRLQRRMAAVVGVGVAAIAVLVLARPDLGPALAGVNAAAAAPLLGLGAAVLAMIWALGRAGRLA